MGGLEGMRSSKWSDPLCCVGGTVLSWKGVRSGCPSSSTTLGQSKRSLPVGVWYLGLRTLPTITCGKMDGAFPHLHSNSTACCVGSCRPPRSSSARMRGHPTRTPIRAIPAPLLANLFLLAHTCPCLVLQSPWVSILTTESSAERAKRRRPPSRRTRTFDCSSSFIDSFPDVHTLISMFYVPPPPPPQWKRNPCPLLHLLSSRRHVAPPLSPSLITHTHEPSAPRELREMKITLFGSSLKL
jgi:hypothetical protein